jgi:hypothetical protein
MIRVVYPGSRSGSWFFTPGFRGQKGTRSRIRSTAPQKYACFLPRTTRERAEAALGGPGAASGAELTQRWRAEWEAAYPDLDMDWKQLMSRYNYHFGSERRESVDAERSEAAAPRFAYRTFWQPKSQAYPSLCDRNILRERKP